MRRPSAARARATKSSHAHRRVGRRAADVAKASEAADAANAPLSLAQAAEFAAVAHGRSGQAARASALLATAGGKLRDARVDQFGQSGLQGSVMRVSN